MMKKNWSKNKLTKAVGDLGKLSKSAGIPLHGFFNVETLQSKEFQDAFGKAVLFCVTTSGKNANWACKKVMEDVLRGFLTILRQQKENKNPNKKKK